MNPKCDVDVTRGIVYALLPGRPSTKTIYFYLFRRDKKGQIKLHLQQKLMDVKQILLSSLKILMHRNLCIKK